MDYFYFFFYKPSKLLDVKMPSNICFTSSKWLIFYALLNSIYHNFIFYEIIKHFTKELSYHIKKHTDIDHK
jgi:hypothetical protein